MRFHSIRFKIRVLFVVLLGAVLIIYSIYLYLSLRIMLYEELDTELSTKVEAIGNAIDLSMGRNGNGRSDVLPNVKKIIIFEDLPDPDEMDMLQEQWLRRADKLGLKEDFIAFLNAKGELLVRSNNLKGTLFMPDVRTLTRLEGGTPVYKSVRKQNLKIRTMSFPYFFHDDEKYIIQVGISLKPIMHILRNRLIHILASIPVVLFLSSYLSGLFVIRFLQPVFEITSTASKITDENLSERVDGTRFDDEMKYLVDAFNSMISRLENSFKGISDFSSHVAHELKTPLTIIKGESDIVLRKERRIEEYKGAINTIREESDRMLRVIEDLLLLARLDFPAGSFNFEYIDIVELIKEIYDQCKILASQRGITVNMKSTQDQLFINGNKFHLRRLFLNLIDNAIKYTRNGGRIDIQATQTDQRIVVSMRDTGIGIAEKDIQRIFDKFYRLDGSGKESTTGVGLGLSIVKSIIDIHHGSIDVKSEVGKGSSFIVSFSPA